MAREILKEIIVVSTCFAQRISCLLDSYLSWCVAVNELLVDFLGFGGQFGGRLCVLVVLTGEVEGDVFLAVLGQQERSEGAQPI